LEKAKRLFWRHGFEGTSISMLTDAMGITAPTLYAAFKSKDALYCEALASYSGLIGRVANTETNAVEFPFVATLERFLRSMAERYANAELAPGCMVSVGALQHGPGGDAAAAATAAVRAKMLASFEAEVRKAQARSELPPEADCADLARFYSAVLQGMAVQAKDGSSLHDLNRIVDFAMAAWPKL
jgi:TetR/AcrR family transcriptional regulator, copper-responsive repressor